MGGCASAYHLNRRGRVPPWSRGEEREGHAGDEEPDCRSGENYGHDGGHDVLLVCQSQDSEERVCTKTSIACLSNDTGERDLLLADEETRDENIANVKHILVRSLDDTCDNLSDKADECSRQNVLISRTYNDDHKSYTEETVCERDCPRYDENQLEQIHNIVLNEGAVLEVNDELDSGDLSTTGSVFKLISGNEAEDNLSEIDCAVSYDTKASSEAGSDGCDLPTSERQCHANTTVPFEPLTVIRGDDDDACYSLPVLPDAESCEEQMSYDSDAVVSSTREKIEADSENRDNDSVNEHSADENEFVLSGDDFSNNSRKHDDEVADFNEDTLGCGSNSEDRASDSEDKIDCNESNGYAQGSYNRDIAQDHPQMAAEPPSKMVENTSNSDNKKDIPIAQPDVNNEKPPGQPLVPNRYPTEVLQVDPELIGYVYERKHFRDQLNSNLEEKEIKFHWKADNDQVSILCCGDDQKECLKTVTSFLDMFSAREIPVREDIWRVALPHKFDIRSITEEEAPKIEPLEAKSKVRVISLKSDIDFYCKQLQANLLKLLKKSNFDGKVITGYSRRYIKFLRKINFVENCINSNCEDCRVEFDEENGVVYLNGPTEQLAIAEQEFDEQELATCEQRIDLSQTLLEITLTEKGKRTVEDALQQCQSTCLFSIRKSDCNSQDLIGEVLGNCDEDVEKAIALISEVVVSENIVLEECNVALTSTPEWCELCENIKAQNLVHIDYNSLPNIQVMGLRDDINSTVQLLQQFVDENSMRKESYSCRSRYIKEFLLASRKHDLQSIEKKLEKFDVKISDGDVRNLYISGRNDGLQQARRLLAEIADSIVATRFVIQQPGLRKTFERVKGDSIVDKISKHHRCLIKLKKKFHQTDGRAPGSETDIDDDNLDLGTPNEDTSVLVFDRYKISWKIGNIADEQVHVLVIPEGECSSAIRKNNPAISEFIRTGAKVGDISVSHGFKLDCHHVFHTRCSNWNGGHGEEILRAIVQKSLQKIVEIGGSSIAFPVIGTGNLQFPPKKASAIMIDETLNFCRSNPHTCLKDVRFIAFEQNSRVVDALREEIIKIKHRNEKQLIRDTGGPYNEIEVVSGDLIDEQTDAIFNIINTDMVMSNAGQVSKAIAKACGPEVQSECRGLGPQPGGSAVLTTAGNLRARHIIHLIPISSTKQHLQMCLEAGLQLADETGLHSISLPAIGTGGFGMSDVISAKMIFESLGNFRKTCKHIRKVKIVVLQEKMIGAFRQEKKRQATGYQDEIALEVWISANDAESVSRAADTLKSDLSGECSYEEICDEGVSKLSDEQLKGLLQQACKGEVDMSVEAAENRISLRGDQVEVNKLLPEIYKEIVSSKKQEEERQAKENASMVSKTVEWVYELDGKKGVFSSKTNHTLEMAHSKEHRSVNVSLEGDEFVIDLSKKRGCGRHSNKRMTVIRRLKQAEEIPLPDHWSLMTTDEVLSVPLDTNLREYQQVFEKFSLTLGGVNITRIHRIQCPFRYRSYTLRKQKMEKDIGDVNERQLFHGTSANITAAINLQGFNRSYCGKHGTVYGQGVYFARDAKYSLSYTSNEDNERCIYLARVLVGQYCVGDSSMKAPPAKDPSRPEVLYDSTVNNKENPSIFVAFSDDQCYPEYLLYFQYNPPASS